MDEINWTLLETTTIGISKRVFVTKMEVSIISVTLVFDKVDINIDPI